LDNPPVVKSQLEFVELVKPKLAIVFIGGNDALGSAFDSDLSQLTPLESFRSDYREIVRRTKATGAQMILATVPDVTASGGLVPFSDLPQITRVAPDLLTRLTGLQPGDFITLRTFQSLIDVIFMGRPGPIPEQLILRKSMARKISKRIADYNKVIRQIGRSNDFLVVDVNRFLDNIVKNGFDVPGVAKINARYFGGLPSFDGVHISITANAVLANFFIDAINKFYNRNFPLVDVTPIALADPQVPKTMMTGSEEALQAAPTPEQWIQHREEFERMGKALTDLFK
jgi:lysophospholipase L1-like esterase